MRWGVELPGQWVGPERSVPHPGPGEPVPPGPEKTALGGGSSPSVVPVPRAGRVLAVAARWDPTTPRARRSWRSGRRMPGSASMRSASAARILLGPEASGPAPRARRVVTEIIVGARTVAQATNDAAGPVPSRAPGGGACGMIGRCRTGEHSSPVRPSLRQTAAGLAAPVPAVDSNSLSVVPTGTRRWKSSRPRESGRSVTSSTCCPERGAGPVSKTRPGSRPVLNGRLPVRAGPAAGGGAVPPGAPGVAEGRSPGRCTSSS